MYIRDYDSLQKSYVFFLSRPARSIYIFISTVFLSVFLIVGWTFFAPIDDIIKAKVLLRPKEIISSIKCITNGQLYLKNYVNNQNVEKGDLLFILDTTIYQKELEVCNEELLKNENEFEINRVLLQTIENEVIPEISKSSDAFIKANSYIIDLQRFYNEINDIKKKLIDEKNKPDIFIIPKNIIEMQGKLTQCELNFEVWKNNKKMEALEMNKHLLFERKIIENQIVEIEQKIKNSTIYAPISGKIIETAEVNMGDYLFSGEEVLKIIPQDVDCLKAEIYVDSNYIARIKVGRPVKMKFLGLPPHRYGMLQTVVTNIPPDATLINGNLFFVVEAEINNPYLIDKDGNVVKLMPGITAEGRIITDTGTVFQMILRKLAFIN